MKKLTILFVFISINLLAANNVEKNSNTGIYEYSHVKEYSGNMSDRLGNFYNKMVELNYSAINKSDSSIKGNGFFTKMIMGTAMEIHYNTVLLFKDSRYKLVVNNFTIKDERYGSVHVEDLKSKSQKRWIELINERLPGIVKNLENTETW